MYPIDTFTLSLAPNYTKMAHVCHSYKLIMTKNRSENNLIRANDYLNNLSLILLYSIAYFALLYHLSCFNFHDTVFQIDIIILIQLPQKYCFPK